MLGHWNSNHRHYLASTPYVVCSSKEDFVEIEKELQTNTKMDSVGENMNEAIESATFNLKEKLKKAHLKHNTTTNKSKQTTTSLKLDIEKCPPCQKIKEELDSGRCSPIVNSPRTSAKFQRRNGVSERNATEGQLLREAVKIATVNENLDYWNFMK